MSICPGSYTDGVERRAVDGDMDIECSDCGRRWPQIGRDRQLPRHARPDEELDVNVIPSSTPCDDCGEPSTWIVGDESGDWVLCDDCHDSRFPPESEAP